MQPYFKYIDFNSLVFGYCRVHCGSQHIPKTTVAVILSYYPKFNGTTFEWKISNNYISKELENLADESKKDKKQSKNNENPLSFDSGFFDVGLGNKFFLRLQPNGNRVTKTSKGHGQSEPKSRDTGNNTMTNNNNNSDTNKKDENFVISLKSFRMPTNCRSIIFHTELYLHRIVNVLCKDDNHNRHSKRNINGNFNCSHSHSYTKQHSTIWTIEGNISDYYTRGEKDWFNTFNWVVGKSKSVINFLKGKNGYDNYGDHDDEINFVIECKIKILQYISASGRKIYLHNDGLMVKRFEDSRSRLKSNEKNINININDIRLRFEWRLGEYICGIINNMNMNKIKDYISKVGLEERKIQFEDDNYYKDAYDEDNEYHSDIFYDMFQLQYDKKGEFSLMICGMPYKTHKMCIKCDLFVKYNNSKDILHNYNKEQVMSEVIAFDYVHSTKKYFSLNTNNKIRQFIREYNRISLGCEITVFQRYDESNEILQEKEIQQDSEKENDDKSETNQENESLTNVQTVPSSYVTKSRCADINFNYGRFSKLNNEIKLSSTKVVNDDEFESDTFVWCIDDYPTISRINKSTSTGEYISKVFKLFDLGFYLSIKKTVQEINVESDGYQECIPTKFDIYILISCVCSYNENTTNNHNNNNNINRDENKRTTQLYNMRLDVVETGHCERWYATDCLPGDFEGYMQYPVGEIEKLNLNQLTIRFNLTKLGQQAKFNYYFNTDGVNCIDDNGGSVKLKDDSINTGRLGPVVKVQETHNEIKEQNEEFLKFENWLVNVVKLPQYMKHFQREALIDLNVVKMMREVDLINIGVDKTGHKLIFIKHIRLLNL